MSSARTTTPQPEPESALSAPGEDFDARYRVLGSRDRRFDGCFYVAVTSTGIYCRPSCPAIVPKRRNVRFYPTAAAAQGAGFRACLRCNPHAVPGSPEWNRRGDVAARAMGLIADGVVDREGVAGLARRLSYSERHLTRQLTAELGAGPLALARAQRSQTARMLIETSALRLIDVAHAAGFSSVRQFNDTIRASYGRTPSELRRRASATPRSTVAGLRNRASAGAPERAAPTNPVEPRKGRNQPHPTPLEGALDGTPGGTFDGALDGPPAGTLTVRLAYREPLAWERLLSFLAMRAVAGVEEVRGGVYRRTLRLPHGHGIVALTPADHARRGARDPRYIECSLRLADLRDLTAAVQRCRRLLDLDADPAVPAEHLATDPLLASLVRAGPGVRVPGTVDGAELAVRAILGQQVSVAAARTAAARLTRGLGEPLAVPDGGLTHLFPSPAAIVAASRGQLAATRAVGPVARRETLRALAELLAADELALDPGSDREEVRARLLAIPGIGPWTAQYIAMRALADPDAFMDTDLGVRRALEALGRPGARRTALALAERWRPWRAYALQYLWGSLAAPTPAAQLTAAGSSRCAGTPAAA
jgi:AraC family transcriptional regulator of adaptative response / DNA-3-methyladenine glycosylase II